MSHETVRPGPVDLSREPDFHVGILEVRPSTREVIRGDHREVLEPKAMQVLVVLHHAAGRVVSRDDLIARCWDGRIVGEDAINRVIWRLRRFSEADGGADFTIETIPKVGYRLATQFEKEAPASSPGPGSEVLPEAIRAVARRRRTAPALWVALGVIAVAAPGLWLFRDRLSWTPKLSEARVAVLQFDTVGPGTELRIVADGLLNEIVSQLSGSRIQTVSPAESKALRGGDAVAIDRLGADMVLDGTVQGNGKAIDVRVHLDDVREHVVLWSGEFHGSADATEALQASVAAQTAVVLYWTKTARSGKVRLDASTLAAFIAGREGMTGVRNSSEGVALSEYRKVVAAAPDFSWGHSAVAVAEADEVMEHPESPRNDALRADVLLEANRALALEPHNGEAWTARELVAPPLDWQGREALLVQGIAADPNFNPIMILEGNLLWAVGRGRDALDWFRRAHDINPLYYNTTRLIALNLASQGRLTESRAVIAQLALQWPDRVSFTRFWTNVVTGATDDTLAQLADPAARPSGMNQKAIDAWNATLKVSAVKEPAAKAGAVKVVMEAASTGSLGRGSALMLLAMLGDLDGAFAQAQLYKPAPPSAPPFLFLPNTAAMRSDPRFMQVAAKLGFVDYWRSTGQWPDFCSEPGLPYDCRAAAKALTPTAVAPR
jgi:DNA-binding winged helix-turn-helix (wHTH) protein/TolB-like protein/tetratricopeptide (TPR) repeat protein